MKLLLHAGIDVALPGGLETHVRELAAGLTARGHEVAILGRASSTVPWPVLDRADPARYELVHHHGGGWPAALERHPCVVRTLHFCVAAKVATYLAIGRWRTLANPANWRAILEERAVGRRRTTLIAVAERVRRDFARHHGLDPARVEVIPNGVSPQPPGEARGPLRARFELPESAPVLLTIGRDDFVKGYDLLSRAWDASGAAARGAWWVTVGGAAPARRPGRLVTGPLPHAEVANWIAASDLGALPSYYEGCSVALLEMVDGRLYSLSHDVGNASEIIAAGVNGEILPRDPDAWRRALERLIARLPARPVAGLEPSFRWPAIVERTEAVYRRALGAPFVNRPG